jgi:hypothetical protein
MYTTGFVVVNLKVVCRIGTTVTQKLPMRGGAFYLFLFTIPASVTGVPDGIFSYQKFQFGNSMERLGMENVGIFLWSLGILYSHLVYLMAILESFW